MSQVPGTKTSTKTTTVNGVTTVVTTVETPGQPTRITTTTTTTTKKPVAQGPPQPQQQQQQFSSSPVPVQQAPEPKRRSGFFSSLKKVLPGNNSEKRASIIQSPPPPQPQQQQRPAAVQQQPQQQRPLPVPFPTPVQQQPQQQRPVPVPIPAPVQQQQPQQQRPVPVPVPTPVQQQPQQQRPAPVQPQAPVLPQIVRHENGNGIFEDLSEKLRQTTLTRPTPVVEHHTTSSTTTTHNGQVVHHSTSSYSGEGMPEDAISLLKRSQPLLAPSFSGQRLDVDSIDFSREDDLARSCPASKMASIPVLSDYLTSPCAGDKVSQLRAIFTWMTNNIAYDVPAFMAGNYGDQSPEGVLHNRKAVCEGYGNLFIALAEPAGLDVKKVIGVARGVDIQVGDERLGSPHAWNAVTIDGEYLLIDSTWGAGVCDLSTRSFRKLFRPFFFLLRPNRLIYTHWPDDPREQFLDPPIQEKVFRDLPAIKPESWGLGIKLAGKHRGQVIRTKDDTIELEVRLKKRPSDGQAGKIVARLNWKGQSVPTSCQWLKDDAKYVWMSVKGYCPSSGQGELNVFGWPPGGDQTKNGPQCLSFRVINEGSGRAAKPMLQQYVVKGFAFSVLEPMEAQVKKNVPQTIKIRVFDVEKGVVPALALQSPDGGMPERLPQVQPGVFETQKVLSAGQWKIVNMNSEYAFSFAAVFDAV